MFYYISSVYLQIMMESENIWEFNLLFFNYIPPPPLLETA